MEIINRFKNTFMIKFLSPPSESDKYLNKINNFNKIYNFK